MILTLEPFVGVGPFEFNKQIIHYENAFSLTKETDGDYTCDHFNLEYPETDLYVRDGVVSSINCYEECIYKGRNIIGMSIDEFMNFYELSPVGNVDELLFEEDNIPQYVYEFDQIGLQVWVKNREILNVIASGADEEE